MVQTVVSEMAGRVYTIGEPLSRARSLALNRTVGSGRALPLVSRLDAAERLLRFEAARNPNNRWLIENWRFLESSVRETRRTLRQVRRNPLPLVTNGPLFGYYRIFEIAVEIAQNGFAIDRATEFIQDYQTVKPLTMAELWSIEVMLRLALIEELSRAPGKAAEMITGLRDLEQVLWQEFFETHSRTEQILRTDPARIYARMDFDTRDDYRHAVAEISRHSHAQEEEVAQAAITLAQEATKRSGVNSRDAHVGFHLVDRGTPRLKSGLQYSPSFRARITDLILSWPTAFYLIGIEVLTLVIAALVLTHVPDHLHQLSLILFLLATEPAVACLNQLSTLLVPPSRLPKLDLSCGIPPDCKTMVVVPTLLLSQKFVDKLLADLEVRFLANRDPQLTFALLTDLPDAVSNPREDEAVVELCATGIRILNERYASEGRDPFYLFHRRREWNPKQGAWMGLERKRGKLIALNNLLRGEDDAFPVKVGDLSVLPSIRYVITLDSDTELPRESAQQLVGALAHPLNRAVIDPATNIVREGYGILQPRVGISVSSANRSRLARIYSGQTGFDLYTTAVSDVYQDLFGEGSYTGKGIYDVDVFQATLAKRFPHDILLSHDLIEGTHARAGLASDIELIDDYPSHYSAWSKRKHRWVRGDWQIMRWLLPRVPDYHGRMVQNPLSVISLWKILDNLRRSLIEIAIFVLLLAGWTSLPGGPLYWTVVVTLTVLLPVYVQGLFALVKTPMNARWWPHLRESAWAFLSGHIEVALRLVFLAHQTCLMIDAILRSVIRITMTGRRLLEWESAAQAEMGRSRMFRSIESYLWLATPLAAFLAWIVARVNPKALPFALPYLVVWGISPLVAVWLNSSLPTRKERVKPDDRAFLRGVALRTWQYFSSFANERENWLVPDNVHQDDRAIAHRTSPTNIGLLLNAHLAACDFGYQSQREFIEKTGKIFATLGRMERHRGHFYNWYDTETLAALRPRFVSTVDSGNLAASLITTRQGLLEQVKQPVIGNTVLEAIADLSRAIQAACPGSPAAARLLSSLAHQPRNLAEWRTWLQAAASRAGEVERECLAVDSRFWTRRLRRLVHARLQEIEQIAPGAVIREFRMTPSLGELPAIYDSLLSKPEYAGDTSLMKARDGAVRLLRQVNALSHRASAMVREMEFGFLFDRRKKLMFVGYDVETATLDPHHYDLLASEARTASFIAIAKSEIPQSHWVRLGRALTHTAGKNVLLSWSGTMFEYLMPLLWMKNPPNTVLDRAVRGAVRRQRQFAKARRVPWGISESACAERGDGGEYRYHAFGVPDLAQNPSGDGKLVIAPYASALALMIYPHAAAANLRKMAKRGWLTHYGFYEAADFTESRTQERLARSFMAHHEGMSLVALDNALNGGVMRKRFHDEPIVQATELLLQEKLPAYVAVEPAPAAPPHTAPVITIRSAA